MVFTKFTHALALDLCLGNEFLKIYGDGILFFADQEGVRLFGGGCHDPDFFSEE